jgi:hypothetical protein
LSLSIFTCKEDWSSKMYSHLKSPVVASVSFRCQKDYN